MMRIAYDPGGTKILISGRDGNPRLQWRNSSLLFFLFCRNDENRYGSVL
jgi:hypothetical protein